jgi:hypothetical protein
MLETTSLEVGTSGTKVQTWEKSVLGLPNFFKNKLDKVASSMYSKSVGNLNCRIS